MGLHGPLLSKSWMVTWHCIRHGKGPRTLGYLLISKSNWLHQENFGRKGVPILWTLVILSWILLSKKCLLSPSAHSVHCQIEWGREKHLEFDNSCSLLLNLCQNCFVQHIRELEHLANSIGGVERFPFIHLGAKTSGCHCRRRNRQGKLWGYVRPSHIASSHTRVRGWVPSWLYLGDIQCSFLWISTIWQIFLDKLLDKSVILCNFD